jgi:hypothetical protein
MAPIVGIKVDLYTADEKGAGTDAPMFIGVASTSNGGGGREFTLDTAQDDFQQGKEEIFLLGDAPGSGKVPHHSKPGEINDPANMNLELGDVNQVYVRKQGDLSQKGKDDPYKLDAINIELFDEQGKSVTFFGPSPLWLGNQFGHQAWLTLEKK